MSLINTLLKQDCLSLAQFNIFGQGYVPTLLKETYLDRLEQIYGRCSKLVSFLAQASMFVQAQRHSLAYYEICPFSVNYESVMFYDTGPPVRNTIAYSRVKSFI
jgi:hypothetical protein